MIVEFRTYRLKPGSIAEAEKRFGEGLANRVKASPLAAFWHTEVGPLNRIIHVWPYEDFAHRERVRAQKFEGCVMSVRRITPRAPGVAAMLTVSMSSSLVPTLPICGNVKVMICPA